jgi:hypothetical protein
LGGLPQDNRIKEEIMKKNVSPGMVVLIVAVILIVIALLFFKGGVGGPNKSAKESLEQSMEKAGQATQTPAPAPAQPAPAPAGGQ